MVRLELRAPSVASRIAGASAGASRRASPKWNAASSSAPATRAERPASSSSAGSGNGVAAGSTRLSSSHSPIVTGTAGAGGRLRSVGGRSWPVPTDWSGLRIPSGSRSNSVGAVGGGSAASGGQTFERGIPAKTSSIPPVAFAFARSARRRASFGRPSAAAASAAMTRASGWLGSSPSATDAASPAPRRSPVRQRTSARSTRPGVSSRPIPAIVSSSTRASDSRPRRRCEWARISSTVLIGGRAVLVAVAALTTAAGGAARGRAGGGPARRHASRIDSSWNSCSASRWTAGASTASTAASASSSVRTRSWSASWPPIHEATWRVSSMRSSSPPDR